jgi:hypothetical protein
MLIPTPNGGIARLAASVTRWTNAPLAGQASGLAVSHVPVSE